jgi:hypothetical protein
MNSQPKPSLQVSMFSIPNEYKTALAKAAAMAISEGKKKSINTIILEALDAYLLTPEDIQQKPLLPKLPLKHYTVRMDADMKLRLGEMAATWQIRTGIPVTMNAVVNTAILLHLQKIIPGFDLPPK